MLEKKHQSRFSTTELGITLGGLDLRSSIRQETCGSNFSFFVSLGGETPELAGSACLAYGLEQSNKQGQEG